jgi:hypothetical protein
MKSPFPCRWALNGIRYPKIVFTEVPLIELRSMGSELSNSVLKQEPDYPSDFSMQVAKKGIRMRLRDRVEAHSGRSIRKCRSCVQSWHRIYRIRIRTNKISYYQYIRICESYSNMNSPHKLPRGLTDCMLAGQSPNLWAVCAQLAISVPVPKI